MNNFTKDELDTLLRGLSHLDEINPNGEFLLANKIQSMIVGIEKQKVCDHEWEYEFNDYHCLKCELRK